MEGFHLGGQMLCKFRTKKMFYTKKGSTLAALVRDTNKAAVLMFWGSNMANATSCKNALEIGFSHVTSSYGNFLKQMKVYNSPFAHLP